MTTIQWFPGHMVETENLLKNAISKTDVVLEIIDARCPDASSNPFVNKLCTQTFRLKVLNKADLADPDKTVLWQDYFEKEHDIPAIAISGNEKSQADKALNYCISKINRNRARKLKVMVIGIPNTGKSTILNSLAGKKIAKTGNVPAVTRHQQRTSLNNHVDLYDTPGILWPVIEPEEKAYILAASGAISDTALDYSDIAYYTAQFLIDTYPALVLARYPFLENHLNSVLEMIENLGRAKGCLKKGGIVDIQKASQALIRELRAGKIGPVTFEIPGETR